MKTGLKIAALSLLAVSFVAGTSAFAAQPLSFQANPATLNALSFDSPHPVVYTISSTNAAAASNGANLTVSLNLQLNCPGQSIAKAAGNAARLFSKSPNSSRIFKSSVDGFKSQIDRLSSDALSGIFSIIEVPTNKPLNVTKSSRWLPHPNRPLNSLTSIMGEPTTAAQLQNDIKSMSALGNEFNINLSQKDQNAVMLGILELNNLMETGYSPIKITNGPITEVCGALQLVQYLQSLQSSF